MTRNGHRRQSGEGCEQTHRHHDLENADVTDGNPLGLEDLPPPERPKLLRWFGLFAFVLISLTMLATVFVITVAKDKKASLLKAEEKRLQASVFGRVKVLQTWLEGQLSTSKRLTDSHVFRLFVADLTLQRPGLPLPRSLQDQRPYFRQLMADFVRQNNLVRAAVIRTDGTTLLSSSGPQIPVASLLQQFKDAEQDRHVVLSPIRRQSGQAGPVVVDAIMTFPETQAENETAQEPLVVLVMTLPIGPILEDVLSNEFADPGREDINLIQEQGTNVERIRMTRDGIELTNDLPIGTPSPGSSAAFGRRNEISPVYSLGEPVEGTPWTLYHTLDARAALSPVHDFVKVASILSLMAALSLTAAFSALWWRHGRNYHRLLVEFYKGHVRRIDHQRQFLQSVTRSIGDWLTVSAPDDKLVYANPAFESVINRSGIAMSGKRWCDLVKQPSTTWSPEDDLLGLIDADMFDVVEIEGDQRIVSTKSSEIQSEDGGAKGTVRIVRDHTDFIAERRRRLSSITQIVNAFVHAIELRDPFLLGHTSRVRARAIAVGKKLELTRDELAGLALAASLSQIGKIFIPDEILAKPDRHSAAEEEIMRDHILHAIDILKRIDFDLPIIDTLGQMHERLDGSGYPHGLAGDRISLSARILGVVDVFCARTAPRSYRDRMSAGKALYHLANNGERYDLGVVAALAEIVGHGPEAVDFDPIERSFIDSAVWQERRGECTPVGAPA